VALTAGLKSFLKRHLALTSGPKKWPFVWGRYFVVDETAPVIVVMPDNEALAQDLAALSVRELCMVSASCRNTSDVEKLIRNLDGNLSVHCVLLAGGDDKPHAGFDALSKLLGGSVELTDKAAALAHAVRGKLKDLNFEALQKRVRIVDMRTCVDVDKIISAVNRYGAEQIAPNTGFVVQGHDTTIGVERVIAPTNISYDLQIDKAGEYVVRAEKKSILVEHYNSKGELLRIVEGTTARDVCLTLIRNGWVSRLDHAAYLGRELTLAETAMHNGERYEQNLSSSAEQEAPVSADNP
jgi:tetrahydromethanopterin S-methyltransferase subunit A